MNLINYINRPHYIFRPMQIYRRLFRSPRQNTQEFENVLLPWGVNIKIRPIPSEIVGRSIWATGIYDLNVTELLWRLIDKGEIAVDVGANIGYMTSIMAKRVGETGKVWAFEPNPEVYQELSENISNWQQTIKWNNIDAQPLALSNSSGVGILVQNNQNRGEGHIISDLNDPNSKSKNIIQNYTVSLAKLDEIIPSSQQIGVMKIDVEGHELEVLQGSINLINAHNIRDIIFEEHRGYPSSVSQFLEKHGYKIFRIWKGFWKPLLEPPTKNLFHPFEAPNYLATREPERCIKRLKSLGWASLYGS